LKDAGCLEYIGPGFKLTTATGRILKMTQELAGKVALITGAGRGIGRGLALALGEAGVAVLLVARTRTQVEEVAGQIEAAGGKACAVVADVTNRGEVFAAVETSERSLGPVDILINNAGVEDPFGPIGIVDPEHWWQSHAVHVRGPLLFMSAVLPGMRVRKSGCIINVVSLAAFIVEANMSAYCVAKSAETRLTEHVAKECLEEGIVAFAIEPGTIMTSMGERTLASPEAQQWIPGGLAYLKSVMTEENSAASMRRCTEMVMALASGRYDGLSGRYLEPKDDFDALLQEGPRFTPMQPGEGGPPRPDA
jgi:NAD(P)-dependent dehydrogenase (short-subunit alcohol dehydrogenase family)